ncbi:glycosyl hydrolase 115 family protein [Flavobacterium sp. RS13.1]|uniref:glycosyl hydrolase 115 family protein n=1 Tax=Flavobacterium sp. RS13.1 TaxID=3400345 RepID=UPI003AAF76A9
MKKYHSFLLLIIPSFLWAIGGKSYVSTIKAKENFTLSAAGKSSPLCINSSDYVGVIRALKDLKADIGKVTNAEPSIVYDKLPSQKEIVIVGTLGKSPVIDQLVKKGKLDVKSIQGKWENFLIQVIDKPFKGVDKAFVIVGSDKRGTIYGIYDVSEQIGVSPWHFWADVPADHKDKLYVKPIRNIEGPSVKYRGVFINDEAPALTGWIKEKYGMAKPSQNPPVGKNVVNYGREFYATVFELLLRIKANYLWPAMWSNAFNEDDPENPRLANEYGIVMGTSHQEPMVRSQQEWDRRYIRTLGHWDYSKHPDTLESFWRKGIRRNKDYESIVTMGLRGANDSEMKGEMKDNIAMVEKIVRNQQTIISEEMDKDISEVPQAWCLYKEIMEYYNNGLRVPDNITLLWADDNWGNIRRLPNEAERKRSGGAGVYYHFDYHGDPRSYEWINTNPLPKIWDQMSLAKEYGADKIWVVNVGHFKGYELPMEYFMSLGWNTNRWNNSNINEFTQLWATREFGEEYGAEIADILSKYGKFNGRCKPESLNASTYSLIHYNEFETVVADYNAIRERAEAIYDKLPQEKRDAFYQIVLFPVKACAIVNELYFSAAKNQLYASQKRSSTNEMALRTRKLFEADTTLMSHYNHIYADGKWNHFMDQTHLGYTDWMPPRKNSLNAVKLDEIQIPDEALMGIAPEGNELIGSDSNSKISLPQFDIFNNQKHYVEIFNKGNKAFDYTITSDVPWLKISDAKGTINVADKRVWFELNEQQLPKGSSDGIVKITGAGNEVVIHVNAFNPVENKDKIKGFIESGGLISIEAEHFTTNKENGVRKWIKVEDYGLTLSGMRATAPANAAAAVPGKDAPFMEYPVYLFSKDSVEITLITSPLLNYMPDRDIKIAVSFDDEAPTYITNVPDKFKVHWSNPAWAKTVVKQARQCKATLKIPNPGAHKLKVWMIDPGVVVQKIVLDTGGVKQSHLGPTESVFLK